MPTAKKNRPRKAQGDSGISLPFRTFLRHFSYPRSVMRTLTLSRQKNMLLGLRWKHSKKLETNPALCKSNRYLHIYKVPIGTISYVVKVGGGCRHNVSFYVLVSSTNNHHLHASADSIRRRRSNGRVVGSRLVTIAGYTSCRT